jgi:hypothetical protein
VSRSRLSLFEVDEGKLSDFASDLRAALSEDARDGVVRLLDLEGPAAARIRTASLAVDVFLASETHLPSASVFTALRRAAKERALTLSWTSESLALEGRLRAFGPLREDVAAARRVDALLDGQGVSWFLRRPGDTCGRLLRAEREGLAAQLERLDDPPEELITFAQALGEMRGVVLCHDSLL